ncbi:DUF1295 domain-containing protein [Kineobactrum sediminis]|nr:DUF1295 domain-containing protein [Kineobactrum sediminis]
MTRARHSMQSLLRFALVLLLAVGIALAGSHGGVHYLGWPVFALCAALAFAVQWLAFVPAYLRQTEKFYDLTGSATYLAVVWLAVGLGGATDIRSLLLAACISLWALRLGSFLFRRIHQDQGDSRFDKIKPDASRFLFTWTLQGLWVVITASCALAAITSGSEQSLGALGLMGTALWGAGFLIEVLADRQKRIFRQAQGSEQFINTGLWARSRHPNYFGEIVLWCGIALIAVPALSGWQWLTLISPVFVFLLLTRVSGVPLLERKADQRWGENPDYQRYKAKTPALVPLLRRPADEQRLP